MTIKEAARHKALVVDDERFSRMNIRDILSPEGIAVDEADDGAKALKMLAKNPYDIVLLDIRMPKMDGLAVLSHLRKSHPQLPVIMFTAHGTSEKAIEAMKQGAFDYVTKPFDLDELLATVHRALSYRRLSGEVQALRQRLAEVESGEFQPKQLVSKSRSMQKVFKIIGKVAPSDVTVLIQGETGTGKELVANALWYHSERRDAPFIKINCAAIPEGLLESELFGHEKGAFTGAEAQRTGRFEFAHTGTLFLDEIAEMSQSLQSKLLRVIEQREFQRVGGKETIEVDVRILAATNRDLQEEVKAGRFRKDLFFRLQVVHLILPPLRERKEDIPALVHHFLAKHGARRGLIVTQPSLDLLLGYSWPGNVRELENVIHRATVLTQGKYITPENITLPSQGISDFASLGVQSASPFALRHILKNVEREVILKALQNAKWNRTKAATLLQIDRRVLFSKIKEFGLKK